MNEKRKIMKHYKNILCSFRTAGFGLAVAAAAVLAACDDEQFVRDAGSMPAEAGTTPSGALYAVGSFDTRMQDFCISEDTDVKLVYRLDYPAKTDVKVTLALGDQSDIDKLNDELGLKDTPPAAMNITPFKRYRLLPESNYDLPGELTLTVQKGKTESAPFVAKVVYDQNLLPSKKSWKRL